MTTEQRTPWDQDSHVLFSSWLGQAKCYLENIANGHRYPQVISSGITIDEVDAKRYWEKGGTSWIYAVTLTELNTLPTALYTIELYRWMSPECSILKRRKNITCIVPRVTDLYLEYFREAEQLGRKGFRAYVKHTECTGIVPEDYDFDFEATTSTQTQLEPCSK